MIAYYEDKLDIELMNYNINDFISVSFIKKNVNKDLDKLIEEINECNNFMTDLSKELSKYVENKKDFMDDSNVIRIISTEKEYYLETTRKRAETIQKTLKKIKIGRYEINIGDLHFDISTRSSIARIRTKYLSENLF